MQTAEGARNLQIEVPEDPNPRKGSQKEEAQNLPRDVPEDPKRGTRGARK